MRLLVINTTFEKNNLSCTTLKNHNITYKNQSKVGNATPSQVLIGNTFTNYSEVGLVGTMPNNGAWSNTPTVNGKVSIPSGYHNGKGYVDTMSVYNIGYSLGYSDGCENAGDIQYIYHEHSNICYDTCTVTSTVESSSGNYYGMCPNCGTYGTKKPHSSNTCTYSCGQTETIVWYAVCPDCDKGFHTYASLSHSCQIIVCGKTTSTIEEAIIIFN